MLPTTLLRSALVFVLAAVMCGIGCGQKRTPITTTDGDKQGAAPSGDTGSRSIGPKPGKHALLVGVTEYDNKAFTNLRYTENDVEQLAEALAQPAAEFASVRVLSVTRGKKNKADVPTAANIKKALDELLVGRTKRDTVLLALAGHGVTLELTDPDGKGEPKSYPYFCAANADLLDPRYSTGQSDTMLNLDELFLKLGRSGAGTKLVMMDACRNEMTVKAARRSLDTKSVNIPDGVAALYSAGRSQVAYETKDLGKGHGVFFYHVIEGLKGKAKNNRGEVTWNSLADYVSAEVTEAVPNLIGNGAKQEPAAMGSLQGASPVLVLGAKTEPKDVAQGGSSLGTDDGKPVPQAKPVTQTSKVETITNSIKMKLALIPAGKFTMGSPTDEKDREGDENPHEVTISKPFYLGVHEVTQLEWITIMGKDSNASHFSRTGVHAEAVKQFDTDEFPVECVTWEQANEFCKKLSALPAEKEAGRVYRLPTEAEWEYACRAGTKSPYHFGDTISVAKSNMGWDSGTDGYRSRTDFVGGEKDKPRKPNAFGLFDMHGNVAEWCSDYYDQRYYKSEGADKDPTGPEEGKERVVRGGSWRNAPAPCRAAARFHTDPNTAENTIGLRVVCEVKK